MRAVPCLCRIYPGICLSTEEKAQKNLSQGGRIVPAGMGYQWSYLNLPPSGHAPTLQRHCSPSCCSLMNLFLLYLPANHWSHSVCSWIQQFQHSSLDMQLLQDNGTNFCSFVICCRELSKRLNSWKRKVNLWWLCVKSAALRKILKPAILLSKHRTYMSMHIPSWQGNVLSG